MLKLFKILEDQPNLDEVEETNIESRSRGFKNRKESLDENNKSR